MKSRWFLGLAVLLLLGLGRPASAGPIVTVDENGNGNIDGVPLPFVIGVDPGPGGLAGVLIYHLPYAGVQGDVLLSSNEPGIGPVIFDVVRFNGDGTLIFYSDNVGGADALADTPSPPGATYANNVTIPEVGSEDNNGAVYTPGPNDPGFDPSGPTYNLISDVVPEPSSVVLLTIGAGFVGFAGWRRRRPPA